VEERVVSSEESGCNVINGKNIKINLHSISEKSLNQAVHKT